MQGRTEPAQDQIEVLVLSNSGVRKNAQIRMQVIPPSLAEIGAQLGSTSMGIIGLIIEEEVDECQQIRMAHGVDVGEDEGF